MSVIASSTIENDEDLILDKKTWDKLKKIDIEDAHKYMPDDFVSEDEEEKLNPNERKYRFYTDGADFEKDSKQESEDSGSEDEAIKKVDRMASELDGQIKQEREYKMLRDKKAIKKELKSKALIDLQRKKKMDESDDEKLLNDDLLQRNKEESSENDDDLDEQRELNKIIKEQLALRKKQKMGEQEAEDEEEKQLFLNPLLAFKNPDADKKKGSDSEEWSDDDKYEPKETREQKKERLEKERKLLGKRSRSGMTGDMNDVRDFFKNTPIEEVPEDDFSKLESKKKKKQDDDSSSSDPDGLPEGYSSMDSDEIAETRALAKKMLRKKFRTEQIENSFSRYAYEDNEDVVPEWFKEDEAKHNMPNLNLTKEEIDEEKQLLREWNARPSKKVMEAKARKKNQLAKAMQKIKNRAQVIANNTEQSEGSKMRQI